MANTNNEYLEIIEIISADVYSLDSIDKLAVSKYKGETLWAGSSVG